VFSREKNLLSGVFNVTRNVIGYIVDTFVIMIESIFVKRIVLIRLIIHSLNTGKMNT